MLPNRSFFPAGAPVSKYLLLTNILCFLAIYAFPAQNLQYTLGLHYFSSLDFYPFQFITYMFMHGGFSHLFFNMFALYMFGHILEYRMGSKRFLIYYFICGLGAALVQETVSGIRLHSLVSGIAPEQLHQIMGLVHSEGREALQNGQNFLDPVLGALNALINTPVVGASGAIFGILLAFGMLFPDEVLYFMFIPVPIKAKYFVVGYAVIELFFGVANFDFDNVAHFAHLGGALFGLITLLVWRRKGGNHSRFFKKSVEKIKNLFERKPKLRVVKNARQMTDQEWNAHKKQDEEILNAILEKIKRSGYESLNADEKRRLFEKGNE